MAGHMGTSGERREKKNLHAIIVIKAEEHQKQDDIVRGFQTPPPHHNVTEAIRGHPSLHAGRNQKKATTITANTVVRKKSVQQEPSSKRRGPAAF
jgi:hypothetical protein